MAWLGMLSTYRRDLDWSNQFMNQPSTLNRFFVWMLAVAESVLDSWTSSWMLPASTVTSIINAPASHPLEGLMSVCSSALLSLGWLMVAPIRLQYSFAHFELP